MLSLKYVTNVVPIRYGAVSLLDEVANAGRNLQRGILSWENVQHNSRAFCP